MGFEETELRLGLPGNGGGGGGGGGSHEGEMVMRKRGFSETESSDESADNNVDLKLNLSSKDQPKSDIIAADHHDKAASKTLNLQKEKNLLPADPAKPPAK